MSRGRARGGLRSVGVFLVCVLQVACAVGELPGGLLLEGGARSPPMPWAQHLEVGARTEVGWPDGVGDGRPQEVPITLDYFQGFLVQAGVPSEALPLDGRTLSPRQALELLPHLLSTPVTLGNFGLRRMAAHLLLEVATQGVPVERETLHARMRRFSELLVARPDGYLVRPTTGEALQWAGNVGLTQGRLFAGSYEVGPFYRRVGGRLYPVDGRLQVLPGSKAVGAYAPDDGVMSPMAEGAFLAMVDTVEGLVRLVFQPGATVEGLTRLPEGVRQLYAHAPELYEAFRAKPYAEQVRTLSRLTTGAVLILGSAGGGAAKAASWGSSLGQASIPLLSLTQDGLLALRLVAVPAGAVVASGAVAVSATYVLHMASAGTQGTPGGSGWPPIGGPGRWVEDKASMSEQARAYQAQVTGAPRGWSYKVCLGDDCVEFDGYDPKTGTLLEAKAREYEKWFGDDLNPKWNYRGLEGLVAQARNQLRLAGGFRVRWHVAEPRMVVILREAFDANGIEGIEIVYTAPLR